VIARLSNEGISGNPGAALLLLISGIIGSMEHIVLTILKAAK
jgi:hypothetical protein